MPDPQTQKTLDAVRRFNDAFNRHDVDAVMALTTSDCVFENTVPPPDGERFVGAAVRGFWERFFTATPKARFETEELFAAGDRAVCRWTFHWDDRGGHVRGVDPVQVAVGSGKVPVRRHPVERHDPSRGRHA